MRKFVVSALFGTLVVTFPLSSPAVERAFEFSGIVTLQLSDPFGEPIDLGTLVNGRFVYETNSSATHSISGCDCTGYGQQHINGFWADFGGVLVRADDYLIRIGNDVPQFPTGVADSFDVTFSSDFLPAPTLPLLVDGAPHSLGFFSIAFLGDPNLYSDSSLPNNIAPSDFSIPSGFNSLSDGPLISIVDVVFSVDSLQPISIQTSDHDLDDDVDGIDFLILQRHFGKNGQNGDADSNNVVNALDLSEWESQYGTSLGQIITVPEPSSLFTQVLLVLLVLSLRATRLV